MARAERRPGPRAAGLPPTELPQTPARPARDVRARLVPAQGRAAAGPRVLVVGDAMLDHYWSGAVERISPEAPVPVLRIEGQRSVPGGAANVALNLAALGSQVTLLTLVGRDEAALQLESMLEAQGVFMERVADAGYSTTQKIRCVARRQQLLRADIETRPAAGMLETLAHRYAALLRGHDLVVLSDYAKGALAQCQPLVRAAREHGIPVLVDPKGKAWDRYCGATLVKPNLAEFRGCAGDFDGAAQFRRMGQALRRRLQLDYLLVTRGEDGMCLFGPSMAEGGRTVVEQPARVREVYDVSGAGDTVLATLAHFMAQGMPVIDAMRWANTAAGIVVGKFGTAAVTLGELQAAMVQQEAPATAAAQDAAPAAAGRTQLAPDEPPDPLAAPASRLPSTTAPAGPAARRRAKPPATATLPPDHADQPL